MLLLTLLMLLLLVTAAAPSGGGAPTLSCPSAAATELGAFEINSTAWLACEDLQSPSGSMVLVGGSGGGEEEWFSKTFEPYMQPATYLGDNVSFAAAKKCPPCPPPCKKPCSPTLHGLDAVLAATQQTTSALSGFDILGIALLNRSLYPFLTRQLVASTLPPIAGTGTFAGSRSSSVDTSLGPDGADASNCERGPFSAWLLPFHLCFEAFLNRARARAHARARARVCVCVALNRRLSYAVLRAQSARCAGGKRELVLRIQLQHDRGERRSHRRPAARRALCIPDSQRHPIRGADRCRRSRHERQP